MRTRWSIANIKHSLVIVFSIAFSCLSYNIPLRLSDSILLRLPANTDCFSTPTHEKPFIDLYRKSRVFPLQSVGKLKYVPFYSMKRENFLFWGPFHKTPTCLFWEAVLFIGCKDNKNFNNWRVSCLETPLFWRYEENYVTRKTPEKFRDFRETAPGAELRIASRAESVITNLLVMFFDRVCKI